MSIVNSLLKVFLGDKSGKDLKKLTPLVDEINKHFIGLSSLSNDELRDKTHNFKKIISNKTTELVSSLKKLNESITNEQMTRIRLSFLSLSLSTSLRSWRLSRQRSRPWCGHLV